MATPRSVAQRMYRLRRVAYGPVGSGNRWRKNPALERVVAFAYELIVDSCLTEAEAVELCHPMVAGDGLLLIQVDGGWRTSQRVATVDLLPRNPGSSCWRVVQVPA